MKYFENKEFTKEYRKEYLSSLFNFVNYIPENYEKNDNELLNHFGYPFDATIDNKIKVDKELLSIEDGFKLYRYHFLLIGNVKLTGLYFEIDLNRPLIIMQHGYLGTPEIMSNIYEDRNSYNYNDIVKRLLNLKVNVFCPQLLMWSIDNYGVDYSRIELNKILTEHGSSLVGLETTCLNQIINYFYDDGFKYIDMFGMSFGGFYTYHVALTNKHIKNYCAFSYLLPKEIEPQIDNDISMLERITRKVIVKDNFFVAFGKNDPIFDIDRTIKFLKEINKNFVIFDGDHEIIKDDDFLRKII